MTYEEAISAAVVDAMRECANWADWESALYDVEEFAAYDAAMKEYESGLGR